MNTIDDVKEKKLDRGCEGRNIRDKSRKKVEQERIGGK